MAWYAYVIECDDGSYYKGHTNDLRRRFQQHCSGQGASHTKKHSPVRLAYYEEVESLEEAVKREKYFKSGSGREFVKSKIYSQDLPNGKRDLPDGRQEGKLNEQT